MIKHHRQRLAAFTLIEIMIVLAIVGLLFSFVGVNVMKKFMQAKADAAKIQIASFQQAIQAYYLDCNFFPHSSQGLESLLRAPTVGKTCSGYADGGYFGKKELPKDPWGNPYRYECEDYKNYAIISNGPDGDPETEDDIKSE